ncbi:MAG: AMP-binding protein [Polyangia bacterium]
MLRASAAPSTIAAILASFDGGTPLALLHPDASADDEEGLRTSLRSLTLDPDTMTLLSTSGSTGTPKRVELSRRAWRAHAGAAIAHLGLRCDDRWLVTLPLAHAGGLSIVVRCHVAGATAVLDEPPRLGPAFARHIGEHADITRLSLVPVQLACLLDAGVAPWRALRSVLLGGQAAPPALVSRALDAGWPIVTSYGMTETCGMCVASNIGERTSAVGRPLQGVALRLASGQLELSTPARATSVHGAAPFTSDGWLRTGDRATITDSGLVLLGRADDVIVSSGHKIDPLEVEAQLSTLPGVAACAVFGAPHEVHGATVTAVIVPRSGADLDALRHPWPPGLATYKRPRRVLFVDALPLLPSGKLDRSAVRKLGE